MPGDATPVVGGALLDGRVAFITGAARGIGLAIARRYVTQGAAVGVVDIDAETAEVAAADLNSLRPNAAFPVIADVGSESDLRAAVSTVRQHFGHLDVAVANAGILALRPVLEMDVTTWRRVLDVNLTGSFLTAKVCAAALVEQGKGGRVIFTGSIMARRGAAENCAYAASKFGVIGLMETLAIELAPHRITVNAVNPGQVQTDMIEDLFETRARLQGTSPDAVREQMLRHIPLARLADPAEVADAYVFLASNLSEYMTGQSIAVEGGWNLV